MNLFIENLNQWGGNFLNFAWPMLWQSSLLIGVVLLLDFVSARKVRPAIRYALWLVVLVKLCLPPTLALPTGAAWWLFADHAAGRTPALPKYVVTYDTPAPSSDFVPATVPAFTPPLPELRAAGWALLGSGMVSAGLLLWLAFRWWQISRKVSSATLSGEFAGLLDEIRRRARLRSPLRLKLVDGRMSPAVCGLFRPVILLPRVLAGQLAAGQLRAVLWHEVLHLRRKDVWVNCAQALLQIVYWWHPLLWLANGRIRRLREEAVDDAAMLALQSEAENYAPTLLAVAKLALRRPLMSLGLVGIMESRSALRKRIERLVNFHAPRKAGLTLLSLCGIFVFSAVALPMGEAPSRAERSDSSEAPAVEQQSLTLKVDPDIFIRNVKAQAAPSLLSPTNDYSVILQDLLRTEGVDCTPPNGIAFNTRTGEITTQNTPDQLKIFREVIEQLNRADGHCALPLLNNPLRQRVVLIEARIYQMPPVNFGRFVSGLQFYQASSGDDEWWSASPEQFGELVSRLGASGLRLIGRPRIQTGSGITAELFIGNETNSVDFDCKPYVADGFVDLALQGTVVGVTPASVVFTNYFRARASAEDRGGIVVRVKNYGGDPDNSLLAAISVEIATNTVHFQERLRSAIGPRNSAVTEPMVAGGNSTNLFTRTFGVRASAITDLSRETFGLPTNNVWEAARSVFSKWGVDWDSPKGKAIFYSERLGLFNVRATESDLDTIQRGISEHNLLPPQVHIKARFVEVPKGTLDGFGKMIGGTNQPDQFAGILTSENAAVTIRTLESRPGVEELAEPEVTTSSGRQTQVRATHRVNIITSFVYQQDVLGTNSIIPQTTNLEAGPVLDVIPIVFDGCTINLSTTASLTEFLGYDQPTNSTVVYDSAGQKIDLPTILPRFAVRKASANIKLWDGQTVVLGAMKTQFFDVGKEVNDEPDYFRKTKATRGQLDEVDKELLVFITVTLVDAAGNRVHSDDEMPFADKSVPPQGGL